MKTLNLNLEYSKASLEERYAEFKDGRAVEGVRTLEPKELTKRLIVYAVNVNNREGLDRKEGRMWARIQDAMDDAVGEAVTLSAEQFDWLYEQIQKTKFPTVSAQAGCKVWDHFDEVKISKEVLASPAVE